MFNELEKIQQKPDVFSVYTVDTLWTDPHLAKQMLQVHLSQETPMASRPVTVIDSTTKKFDAKFGLQGKKICDLGCGPGLYAEKYASLGARVHGMDFSANSIQYAKSSAARNGCEITYEIANYLEAALPTEQDLITLIYCDLCALSPALRKQLYSQVRKALRPGGTFIFDVLSVEAFHTFTEHCTFAPEYMDRFWSANRYYTFHNAYRYEDDKVSLDHYTIIEEQRTWHVYNWLQYFTPESIHAELTANGFEHIEITDGFDAEEAGNTSFAVMATVQS